MKNFNFFSALIIAFLIGCISACSNDSGILYKSDTFSIYPDKAVQGTFEAKALSATEMVSNYESPANAFQDAFVSFKFSINGKDNEMAPGTDHQMVVKVIDGRAESPLIVFGQQYVEEKQEGVYLQPETPWHLKVDMRPVLKSFEETGFYTNAKGEKIYMEDFKALYVAGNALPMTWDFDNLRNRAELELKDPDGDGIFETTLILNSKADIKKIDSAWRLSKDISAFPQYQSPHVLADAIYNMSLEEMEKAIEKDSTLRTGAEWAGVWTRDVSYSIILSMAYMQPQVAKNSLRRKVNARKRIIQDTGTGGAWPVSTDRMIWAAAAWEIFLVTGEMDWLKEIYEVIKLSLEDDYKVAYDEETGLVKGESSFLDWREQTYPKWMEPADIFESECLGTNAAHYQANRVAAKMARILNDDAYVAVFEEKAAQIKEGINKYLWQQDRGYYGQYLYGQVYKVLSPRSEALGEALAVLFDIADKEQQQKIVSSTPVVDYGIPCIYPQIPGIPPYHNNGIWPFVQTYWLMAGAKAANEQSVMHSIASLYRPSALFLTNKENFVADNGDFSGTVINSSNMLWSLSGNIGLVHKVLFGIKFTEDGLTLNPFVPKALLGNRKLSGFKYRSAVLDIELEGYGDQVQTITLDGEPIKGQAIPTNISGAHTIRITLNNGFGNAGKINLVKNAFSPATPLFVDGEGKDANLKWTTGKDVVGYSLYKNGSTIETLKDDPSIKRPEVSNYLSFQLASIGNNQHLSFVSSPFEYIPENLVNQFEAENYAIASSLPYKGFSAKGFVEISNSKNRELNFKINVEKPGWYELRFRYANGNGPINTENKCATRSVYLGNSFMGSVVFPQRGTNEWSDWGFSNSMKINLPEGESTLSLRFEDWNENMNGAINQAMIDFVRVIFLNE
jgi:hypothetical protein